MLRAKRRSSQDVAEVCRLAKTMQVPVAEVQRFYNLFKENAEPLGAGTDLLRDGRVVRAKFDALVRRNLVSDSDILAKRSIDRAFQAGDVDRDGALSFDEFVDCMHRLSFDEAFNVTSEDRELRRIANEHRLSLIEVERYKRLFDEVDVDGSGRIESSEFESLLYKCGNISRDIISAARAHSLRLAADPNLDGNIDFEEFVAFGQKYFGPGATGLGEHCRRHAH
jgi:Ca2+-binding EF-hand superfamily protein